MSAPLVISILLIVTALSYVTSLENGFHYDDFHSIVRNPHIRTLENIPSFFIDPGRFSVNPESAMYRPVLLTSYAVNFAFGELRPVGYHFVNVSLHVINIFLVHRLLLLLSVAPLVALVAAVLFALHPVHSEAVNYISSRSELLVAFCILCTCCAHMRFISSGKMRWYIFSLLLAALALGSKAVAVSLVLLLPLCVWYRYDLNRVIQRWRYYAGYGVLVMLYALIAHSVIDKAFFQPIRSFDVHAFTQLKAIPYYLFLAVLPVHLTPEHQFALSRRPDEVVVLAFAFVMTGALLCWKWRQYKTVRLIVGWSLVALAPSLLVPLIVLVNEHRCYLAGVGFALVCALALLEFANRKRFVAVGVGGFYTISLGVLVLHRNEVWSDEISLWRDAAVKAPERVKPLLKLGDALQADGMLKAAEESYRRAIAIRQEHPAALNNLGRLYLRTGRLGEAEKKFSTLLAVSPDNVAARLNLAGVFMRSGHWQKARLHYEHALQYGHTQGNAQENLAHIALRFENDPGSALSYLNDAIALSSEDAVRLLIARGIALRGLGRLTEAEADYRSVLQIDSTYADAWYNLGNLLLEQHRDDRAKEVFERVIALGKDSVLTAKAQDQIRNLSTRSD